MPNFPFWRFSTVARFASVRTLAMNWQNLSCADRQFCLGARPQSPCYFEGGWVAPSKPKFKQHLTTSFCWPSHDVTRGVYISLHLEFRSSWTSCNIWVAFRKQVSLYSCNFEDTVNSTFCCVTSISIFSVKATSMLQFEQLDIHILCCRQATIELCTLQRQKSFVYAQ